MHDGVVAAIAKLIAKNSNTLLQTKLKYDVIIVIYTSSVFLPYSCQTSRCILCTFLEIMHGSDQAKQRG